MKILHTESSNGWGGQELRILSESLGMQKRGHEIFFAVQKGGSLVEKALQEGFKVYEIDFKKRKAPLILFKLLKIVVNHQVDLINTHSSLDAWFGGLVARFTQRKIIRTRHLSTRIRGGWNSRILYNSLADYVVTTSSCIIPTILKQASLPTNRCGLVATGVEESKLDMAEEEPELFRKKLGLKQKDFLIGTACVVRSWKGVEDFIHAAYLLKSIECLKWIVIGGGYLDQYQLLVQQLQLQNKVYFTGHLTIPYSAIASLDVFALLSTAHEGISQACLQAAYFKKPLITTTVGGLPEVCIQDTTGILVPPSSPSEVAKAVLFLLDRPDLRKLYGMKGNELVKRQFTLEHTLDQMEKIYDQLMEKTSFKKSLPHPE